MAKREKENCERCGTPAYLHKHHVLPKSIFLGLGPVIKLCPNCHEEYHAETSREEAKNTDKEFHENRFKKWFKSFLLFLVIGAMLAWLSY